MLRCNGNVYYGLLWLLPVLGDDFFRTLFGRTGHVTLQIGLKSFNLPKIGMLSYGCSCNSDFSEGVQVGHDLVYFIKCFISRCL